VDSRAAPKAAGVSGGSPAGRAYRHGWAILEVPKSALSGLAGDMSSDDTPKAGPDGSPSVELLTDV